MKIQERAGAGNHRSSAPAQPAVGERLPAPPRERKPALAALAVLLILIGALGATVLVLRAGDRVEVVKVTREVPAGQSVTSEDVESVLVADDTSISYVKWEQLAALKKLKARFTIAKGSIAVGEMFSGESGLPAGKSSVGLALKEGQYPAGLKSGDVVAAYQVGDDAGKSNSTDSPSGGTAADGAMILDNGRINSVSKQGDATVSTGAQSVTLIVDSADAAALTKASSAGEVALVLVPSTSS